MATVKVKTAAGKENGTVELPDAVFGVQPNVPVMHQVVTAQLAHRRAGTQSTKTRSEVSGGGKKPFRQKGTPTEQIGTKQPRVRAGSNGRCKMLASIICASFRQGPRDRPLRSRPSCFWRYRPHNPGTNPNSRPRL